MGLDMYLNRCVKSTDQVGYWRKANAIHNWFETVLERDTNCNPGIVTVEQLQELKYDCLSILQIINIGNSKADIDNIEFTSELINKILKVAEEHNLCPIEGFFFGGTEIDKYYFYDLIDTIEIIDNLPELDEDEYFEYGSWW